MNFQRESEDIEIIRQVLRPRERLLWMGRPMQRKRLDYEDLSEILIGLAFALIPFVILLLLVRVSASHIGFPQCMLIGVILLLVVAAFVGFGVRQIIGVLVPVLLLKRDTFYAVTDKRALLISEFPNRKVESRRFSTELGITKTVEKNGLGSIAIGTKFGSKSMPLQISNLVNTNTVADQIEFINLPDVETVYALITEQLNRDLPVPDPNGIDDVFPFLPDDVLPASSPPRILPIMCYLRILFTNMWTLIGLTWIGISTFLYLEFLTAQGTPIFVKMFTLVFPILGLLVVAGFWVEYLKTIYLLRHGEVAYGELISIRREYHSGGRSTPTAPSNFNVEFKFRANNDKTYTARTTIKNTSSLTDQEYEIVLYDKEKPTNNALLDSIQGRPKIDNSGIVRMKTAWLGFFGMAYAILLLVLISWTIILCCGNAGLH